ncbi:MAG TPA: DUF3093 domain-containing protein [Jatrophihabitantaceae bacterium]
MATGNDHRASAGVVYRESLRTPWWWYLVGLFVAGLLAAEFHISGLQLTDWLSFGILLPLSAVLVWSLGRGRLEISGGELRVRGAHIPLDQLSGVVALDARTLRRVVGREGDPAAFVSIRPWIGPGVQLWLDDPDDPTPYWVVSTRRPRQVVEIVRGMI